MICMNVYKIYTLTNTIIIVSLCLQLTVNTLSSHGSLLLRLLLLSISSRSAAKIVICGLYSLAFVFLLQSNDTLLEHCGDQDSLLVVESSSDQCPLVSTPVGINHVQQPFISSELAMKVDCVVQGNNHRGSTGIEGLDSDSCSQQERVTEVSNTDRLNVVSLNNRFASNPELDSSFMRKQTIVLVQKTGH